MRKVMVLLSIFSILIISSNGISAKEEKDSLSVEGFEFYIVEETKEYQKLEIINTQTNEKEYVTTYYDEEGLPFLSKTDDSFIVELSTDFRNEEIINIYEDNVLISSEKTILGIDSGVSLRAYGGWTAFKYRYNSVDAISTNVGRVVAILTLKLRGLGSIVIGEIAQLAVNQYYGRSLWFTIGSRQRWNFANKQYETNIRTWVYSDNYRSRLVTVKNRYYVAAYD